MSKINIDSFSFVEQIIDYSCVDNWINTCCSRYSSPFFLGKFCSWEYVSSTYVKYPVITEDGLWAKERLYCPPPFAASILEHGLRRVHVPASGCGSWAEVEEGRRSMRRAKGSLHVARGIKSGWNLAIFSPSSLKARLILRLYATRCKIGDRISAPLETKSIDDLEVAANFSFS